MNSPTTAARRLALGAYGERVAERHLLALGLTLLDRNWRCTEPGAVGELDLVLRDGSALVACEVKTRSSTACGTPHEAISDAKLDRLRRLAVQWARSHDLEPPEIRVDLVAVLRPPRGPAVVEHVQGLG